MIIYDWMECPYDTPGKTIRIKNTISDKGLVTKRIGNELTFQQSAIVISPRRFSVLETVDDLNTAKIISISYKSGYDTFNEPKEIFKQYLSGNYVALMTIENPIADWNGSAQQLVE